MLLNLEQLFKKLEHLPSDSVEFLLKIHLKCSRIAHTMINIELPNAEAAEFSSFKHLITVIQVAKNILKKYPTLLSDKSSLTQFKQELENFLKEHFGDPQPSTASKLIGFTKVPILRGRNGLQNYARTSKGIFYKKIYLASSLRRILVFLMRNN